jgi:hypothetical protein
LVLARVISQLIRLVCLLAVGIVAAPVFAAILRTFLKVLSER